MKKITLGFIVLIFLTGCAEINSTDPEEVYKYWTDSKTPDSIKLINGRYWQSAHLTREYILFLKFKPPESWWTAFIEQNKLKRNSTEWIKVSHTPNWFKPTASAIMYRKEDNFGQGSRYFKDTLTNVCYIYEIQL